jgi:hypothetical protein
VKTIGEIVRLQVQRSSLKLPNLDVPAAAHPQRYDPSPLLGVPRLLLTAQGVIGLLDDDAADARVLDVHNALHPLTKNHDGINDVSVGFTAHYAAMRQRFGPHLGDGIAGENVLVQTTSRIEPEQVQGGLAIETRDGQLALLESVVVAEPCVPFTRFCLRLRPADPSSPAVTDGLRWLREGMRGFYANYAGADTAGVVLRIGDRVCLPGG